MGDGCGLEAVELVQLAGDAGVRDKVIDVGRGRVGGLGGLVDEGRGARERVVDGADQLRV